MYLATGAAFRKKSSDAFASAVCPMRARATVAYWPSRTQPVCHSPTGSAATIIPWLFLVAVLGSRTCPMRRTASLWRHTFVSSLVHAAPSGGGFRQASHSARASLRMTSAARPLAHARRACAVASAWLGSATNCAATPIQPSAPSFFWNAVT